MVSGLSRSAAAPAARIIRAVKDGNGKVSWINVVEWKRRPDAPRKYNHAAN